MDTSNQLMPKLKEKAALPPIVDTKKPLLLKPVAMIPEVMDDLEKRGLIIRLFPRHHECAVPDGVTKDIILYKSAEPYGTHKLISVTVNRSNFSTFGSHLDNEEFLLIGDTATKPLYLVIALHVKQALQKKIQLRTLSADDFVCLRVRYNDPMVSFFTMLANVPHGEAIEDTDNLPPASFYVTEPSAMGTEVTDFGSYRLTMENSHG